MGNVNDFALAFCSRRPQRAGMHVQLRVYAGRATDHTSIIFLCAALDYAGQIGTNTLTLAKQHDNWNVIVTQTNCVVEIRT